MQVHWRGRIIRRSCEAKEDGFAESRQGKEKGAAVLLKDRVTLVTGGGSGIGRSTALALANEGAKVVVYDLQGGKAREVCDLLASRGKEAMAVQGSVADERQVEAGVRRAVDAYGSLDILVNSAGILDRNTVMEEVSLEEWQRVIGVNLTGVFICCRAVLPYMKRNRRGKIILIGSTAGQRMGVLGGVAYASSKSGLNSFTRHLAFEAAPYGINVNMILPGPVATALRDGDQTKSRDRDRQVPMGRVIAPEEIADAVVFLASERAKMITGAFLPVDGGILTGWFEPSVYYEKILGRKLDR
jgi:NAD(P)-dependent dehydrogenase (short-subunit alcohol dehydrogenase family)